MSEDAIAIINGIGILVAMCIGLGISWLLNNWYGRHNNDESPRWMDWLPITVCILLWLAVILTLKTTVWKPPNYIISISW